MYLMKMLLINHPILDVRFDMVAQKLKYKDKKGYSTWKRKCEYGEQTYKMKFIFKHAQLRGWGGFS